MLLMNLPEYKCVPVNLNFDSTSKQKIIYLLE